MMPMHTYQPKFLMSPFLEVWMVTDRQVRRLLKLLSEDKSLAAAADQASMDEKTARKYRRAGRLPSELKSAHAWKTRQDPFEAVWHEIQACLEESPALEAKTLFEWLQAKYPGRFADGQLRTLQRRVRLWRATQGPPKEVFFAQKHHPGQLGASDFTSMQELEVTLCGRRFSHLLYHFVLTYSNWEFACVCFSESFESLSKGLQDALWKLGAAPRRHRSDRLSAAVHNDFTNRGAFTQRYGALMRHYDIVPERTQPRRANENGDVEQSHNRLKRAVEQALLLRGSRDFSDRAHYEAFLAGIIEGRNAGRQKRLEEERKMLAALPARRLESVKILQARVGPSSTISVERNVYSVPSRMIGELVEVRLYAEHLEVWYAQRCVEGQIPRLRGRGHHAINYRHVIDWLVRKPGAFLNYRYCEDMFPTSRFRMAWDVLSASAVARPEKYYLRILELAARTSQAAVDQALRTLIEREEAISPEAVERLVEREQALEAPVSVHVDAVNLARYDQLLSDGLDSACREGVQ
jgi:hypothetical protein